MHFHDFFRLTFKNASISFLGCLTVIQPDEKSFISPCCGRLYHTSCVQHMANSYGSSHFKCPMCQEKEKFAKEAASFGIYIPFKDADWEHPDNEGFYEYQQMGELHQTCDAKVCRCTKVTYHSDTKSQILPINSNFYKDQI